MKPEDFVEFGLRSIPCEEQWRYDVLYKTVKVGEYVPDLIAFASVVVEAKVIVRITDHELGQMLIRDHAPLEQLVVLTHLESLNSVLIRHGLPQPERLATLNGIAITQMRTLLSANSIKRLK